MFTLRRAFCLLLDAGDEQKAWRDTPSQRDMRGIGHLGPGDLEVRIASAADLEKAGPLIRRAFEAA